MQFISILQLERILFCAGEKPPNRYKLYYILSLNDDKTMGQIIQLCLTILGTKIPYFL